MGSTDVQLCSIKMGLSKGGMEVDRGNWIWLYGPEKSGTLTLPIHICFLNCIFCIQNLHLRFQAALVRLILKANHQPVTVFWGKKKYFQSLLLQEGDVGEQGEEILKYWIPNRNPLPAGAVSNSQSSSNPQILPRKTPSRRSVPRGSVLTKLRHLI